MNAFDAQRDKIRELRIALMAAGFSSLDKQAAALGLARSTTWAILQGNHKCTGLRAELIARMLRAPALPPSARQVLVDYVTAKSSGAYGHSEERRKRFAEHFAKVRVTDA